jgi:glucose-6-phosphate 1-dehydrogenase
MSQIDPTTEPAAIVILGASGDLTRRKLVPALHSLACGGLLSPDTQVIGVARTPLSDGAFRDRLYEGVAEYARVRPAPGICELWPRFAGRYCYLAGSYDDPETYRRLGERLVQLDAEAGTQGNRYFYLATPPTLFPVIIEQLGRAGLSSSDSGWTRIIIEKPFGHDLDSARRLNEQIHGVFDESQVYRIDHYLGKETVQNILTFRFSNAIFEPLWNRNYVDHVQIAVLESAGVGHRAGYYEQAGVVRDMVQNHLVQLLTLTAMDPPVAFDAKSLRDEKVKVLQAVRPISLVDSVWGQYEGYRDETGVASDSRTPTYVALRLCVDNWRWQGVPFYLRTGKRLHRKSTEITLQFKKVPHPLFPGTADLAPNWLSLSIQPDEGIHLRFQTKVPGAGMRTAPVDMEFHYRDHFGEQELPDAYERLLLDALNGDASLFARSDEIERAWALVDPILDEWERQEVRPPITYEPGSWGPAEANEFIGRDSLTWLVCCGIGRTA